MELSKSCLIFVHTIDKTHRYEKLRNTYRTRISEVNCSVQWAERNRETSRKIGKVLPNKRDDDKLFKTEIKLNRILIRGGVFKDTASQNQIQ